MINYIPVYNLDLLPVLISIVFLSSVVLWIAITNYKNFIHMFFIIPLSIFAGWTIYTTIDSLLGYPVPDNIKKDSMYVSHLEGVEGNWIYVWLIVPGDSRPKAIMVPNTKDNKKSLEEAKRKSENGISQAMEQVQEQIKGGETNGGLIRTYDFVDQDGSMGKEPQASVNNDGTLDGKNAGPVDRQTQEERDALINRLVWDGQSEIPSEHHNPFLLDWGWPDGTTHTPEKSETQEKNISIN